MTYLVRNKEFRVRHENITGSGNQGKLGRYWFDDTAARVGGIDGVADRNANLTGTQTIIQDDIGIIRTTTSGRDSGLPAGEYELIYKSLVKLSSTSSPEQYQIVQSSANYSTFTPPPLQNVNAYINSSQRGINITWSDWTSGLSNYRIYDIYWRFSTTGAVNGSKSNLRIFNYTDTVNEYEWEDVRIIKLS